MASERQIAANRRNAQKSAGPRTKAGKQRASGNAYRHGLRSRPIPTAAFMQRIEELACEIAAGSNAPIVLAWARTAADATLELDRVRRTKVALIEEVARLGELDPQEVGSGNRDMRLLRRWLKRPESPMPHTRKSCGASVPPHEPERTAEAVRRLLPQLVVLERYERRAWWRRERAMQGLQERLGGFKG